jgi:hypothetical protein
MNASLRCPNCDEAVTPAQEKCEQCDFDNPHYQEEEDEDAEPEAPVGEDPAKSQEAFALLIERLADPHAADTHVIANIGLSEAGKSWLIARMGDLRDGDCQGAFYTGLGSTGTRWLPSGKRVVRHSGEIFQLCNGDVLPRTSHNETYVWNLVPKATVKGTRSGKWRVVDIPGELIRRDMIQRIAEGTVFYDLILMTLAYTSALVLVIDGREIAHPTPSLAEEDDSAETGTLDQRNALMVQNLTRLIRFIEHWKKEHRQPRELKDLASLKEAIRDNPSLQLPGSAARLEMPTLLVMSKADELIRLSPEADAGFEPPGPDATRFAARALARTHKKARDNIATFRWAFVAPFVGQPRKGSEPRRHASYDPSEVINFDRPSYGVRQALLWLDDELSAGKRRDVLVADHALDRLNRWLPPWTRRKVEL